VVIGSGAGGGTVAARLAERDTQLILSNLKLFRDLIEIGRPFSIALDCKPTALLAPFDKLNVTALLRK